MRILAIESSCDETAASIVEVNQEKPKVITSVVSSQISVHATTGGVIPNLAARLQTEAMPHVLNKATNNQTEPYDAIAVTVGPGLIGSLLVGVATAKTLALLTGKPFYGINHLEGHIYSAWLSEVTPELPALVLTVSGGHTELIYLERHLEYQHIGATRDDAAGEAFDKVARLLGLGYPGGPEISKLAVHGDRSAYVFPIGLPEKSSTEFSFSGLKASVAHLVTKTPQLSDQQKADIAASFEYTVFKTLERKLTAALNLYPKTKTVAFVGGVSANTYLREALTEYCSRKSLPLVIPPLKYCTDNAAMIGAAASMRALFSQPDDWYNIEADPNKEL